MWREFLFKMGRTAGTATTKRLSVSSSSDGIESEEETSDSDSSGNSGHYSFRTHQSSEQPDRRRLANRQFLSENSSSTIAEESNQWREKFEFTLSLIGEPRYLLAETLVAEQLKLTLKQQAYRLELLLLRQTIEEDQQKDMVSSSTNLLR